MRLLVLFVVFLLEKVDLSQSRCGVVSSLSNNNNIIKHFKNYTYEKYEQYLSGLLKNDNISTSQELNFPKSLTTSNYSLTDGTVSRFYDPVGFHGGFDRVIFHQLKKEFFGITQIYGPKIEFTFNYTTNFEGSKKTGSLSLVVSHSPLELQLDMGDKENGTCTVNTKENDVFYFYDDKLTLIPKFEPPTSQQAGQELVKQMSESWLDALYKIIMKVKIEKIAVDTKQKILTDKEFQKHLKHICTVIQ